MAKFPINFCLFCQHGCIPSACLGSNSLSARFQGFTMICPAIFGISSRISPVIGFHSLPASACNGRHGVGPCFTLLPKDETSAGQDHALRVVCQGMLLPPKGADNHLQLGCKRPISSDLLIVVEIRFQNSGKWLYLFGWYYQVKMKLFLASSRPRSNPSCPNAVKPKADNRPESKVTTAVREHKSSTRW